MLEIDISKNTPYSGSKIMSLISDVENYDKFIPLIKAIRIWDKASNEKFKAELLIGYKAFRIPFSTQVEIDEPAKKVITKLVKVPSKGLFDLTNQMKYLDCEWAIEETDSGSLIRLKVDFDFKDTIISSIVRANLEKAKNKVMELFLREADKRFARD